MGRRQFRKGQLYIRAWDGKMHLYGAESGAWTVDEGASIGAVNRCWGQLVAA